MKQLLIILATLIPASYASADVVEKMSVHFSSRETYYNCSYAENQLENYLQKMGYEVVKTSCSGGIEFGQLNPQMTVRAQFVATAHNGWTRIEFKGKESCDLNVQILKTITKEFGAQNIVKKHNCNGADGRYSFAFDYVR